MARVTPIRPSPDEIVDRIDAVRDSIRLRNGDETVRRTGETWRDLIDEGRRIPNELMLVR